MSARVGNSIGRSRLFSIYQNVMQSLRESCLAHALMCALQTHHRGYCIDCFFNKTSTYSLATHALPSISKYEILLVTSRKVQMLYKLISFLILKRYLYYSCIRSNLCPAKIIEFTPSILPPLVQDLSRKLEPQNRSRNGKKRMVKAMAPKLISYRREHCMIVY